MTEIHKNENYTVTTSDQDVSLSATDPAYEVWNNKTGQREFKADTLPEAIDFAEHNNTYLVNRLYSWIAAKGQELKAEQESSTFSVE